MRISWGEKMKELTRFLYEVGQLQRVRRSGFSLVGVENPHSTADHSHRAAVIGYFLAKLLILLDKHEKIRTVYYPGLTSHPDHEVARKLMDGFGGMLSFEVDGNFDRTKLFMDELKLIKLATSLGGVSSLANQPITNTHAALSPENRTKAGISESLVRLSVGVEKVDLLIDDLKQALEII